MKKIDRLLITSFVPPFFVTFMIAMFVLVMQVLWLYIDDIAGKGLGFFLIMELLAYKCVALIPMALPLAVLISSVMVLGNLAERYELSSFKSAGVSLLRVLRPMIFFGIFTVGLSFFCSNNLIPVANLKFGSRMYDIQRQKPSLRLDAGIFNDDFDGYAIHIGKKDPDGKTIEHVLIYDHTDATKGRLSQILAESGEMYATPDGSYFVMNLKKGHQYIETEPSISSGGRSYPFVRTNFDSWTKVFDLSEFQLNRTNEDLFKSNRSMMTSGQLSEAVDSLGGKILRRQKGLSNQISGYFSFMKPDSAFINLPDSEEEDEPADAQAAQNAVASAPASDTTTTPAEDTTRATASLAADSTQATADTSKPKKLILTSDRAIAEYNKRKAEQPPAKIYEGKPLEQVRDKPLEQDTSFVQLFKKADQRRLFNKAKSVARSIHAHSESAERSLDRLLETRVKFIYELHTKYSMALVCFIFVLIGGPMGAIVRKGGFGYPILIAIIFFMLFIVLTIFCRKIAESFVLPAAMAAWIPCGLLFPIGLLLTIKAMNDSKVLNPDRLVSFFSKLFKRRAA
ncbi:MAG: LptF/LptG family permease [Lewinellaceae bacterium]|nr:LptF/LptG family permease [Lewinellaceae bacterium]